MVVATSAAEVLAVAASAAEAALDSDADDAAAAMTTADRSAKNDRKVKERITHDQHSKMRLRLVR